MINSECISVNLVCKFATKRAYAPKRKLDIIG